MPPTTSNAIAARSIQGSDSRSSLRRSIKNFILYFLPLEQSFAIDRGGELDELVLEIHLGGMVFLGPDRFGPLGDCAFVCADQCQLKLLFTAAAVQNAVDIDFGGDGIGEAEYDLCKLITYMGALGRHREWRGKGGKTWDCGACGGILSGLAESY